MLVYQTPLKAQEIDQKITVADYKPGYCPITNEPLIDNFGRPNSHYGTAFFETNRGTILVVAMDKDIIDGLDENNFPEIMEYVKTGWQWELNRKKWTPKQLQDYKDYYMSMTITRQVKDE